MKPTPKQITKAFIAPQKGKVSAPLLRQFAVAANALCDAKESFNFNTFLALISPNAKLVNLYFDWLSIIKMEKRVKHQHGNWSMHRFTWKD